MTEAVIYDGIRSPVGKHAGALSKIRPDELLAATIKGLVSRSDFDLSLLEDVICGDSNQAGEDCPLAAAKASRFIVMLHGMPVCWRVCRLLLVDKLLTVFVVVEPQR